MSKFPSDRVACLELIPSTNNDDEFWTTPKTPPTYLMALESTQTVKEGKLRVRSTFV